jgi:transposase
MVELVEAGRIPAELAREFGCSANSILSWVHQAKGPEKAQTVLQEGALSPDEREELRRLRRENRELKLDREILAKATAWFAAKSGKTHTPSSSS